MAEPTGGGSMISNQRLVIITTVLVIVITLVLFFSFRSCSGSGSGYTTIYSNLELSDSAKVVARLKELKIPYEVKEKGTAVSVPKGQSSQARLGLAEKNLPTGGVVGWEIFNETKMGATDFDRRIQLIRAISGELSRTIRQIRGVQDARVQIVLPETRLFEVSKAPVTASVLLKIVPGEKIKSAHIRGIIHLVASSVENLKTENVTVVDENGNILSAKAAPQLPKIPPKTVKAETTTKKVKDVASKEVVSRELTTEEKDILKLKAKEEYERQLASACQKLLNKFTAPNSTIAQVSVEFGKPKKYNKYFTRLKIKNENGVITANIKKITVIVLVDKRLDLTSDLKKNIYQTISDAIPYNRDRGDRISIRPVPFRAEMVSPDDIKKQFAGTKADKGKKDKQKFNYLMLGGISGGVILLIIIMVFIRRGKKKSEDADSIIESEDMSAQPPTEEEASDAVEKIKEIAENDPEKVAELLKKWLTEE